MKASTIIKLNSPLAKKFSKLFLLLTCQSVSLFSTVLEWAAMVKNAESTRRGLLAGYRAATPLAPYSFFALLVFPTLDSWIPRPQGTDQILILEVTSRERKGICVAVTMKWWMAPQVTTVCSLCSHRGGITFIFTERDKKVPQRVSRWVTYRVTCTHGTPVHGTSTNIHDLCAPAQEGQPFHGSDHRAFHELPENIISCVSE